MCHKLYYVVVEMVIVVRLKLPCGRVVVELTASMMIYLLGLWILCFIFYEHIYMDVNPLFILFVVFLLICLIVYRDGDNVVCGVHG